MKIEPRHMALFGTMSLLPTVRSLSGAWRQMGTPVAGYHGFVAAASPGLKRAMQDLFAARRQSEAKARRVAGQVRKVIRSSS